MLFRMLNGICCVFFLKQNTEYPFRLMLRYLSFNLNICVVRRIALFSFAQQFFHLRQLRLHAVEVLLHVVNLLLGFVVDCKVDD